MKWCLLLVLSLLAAQEKPAEELKEFASREGGFRLLLPGEPKEQTTKQKGPDGKEVTNHVFVVDQKTTAYLVAYLIEPDLAKLGADEAAARLEKVRDGLRLRLRGDLDGEKRITLDGHPGLEVQLKLGGDKVYRSRLFIARDRLYQVTVLGPKETVLTKEADRILDSFQLRK